MPNPKQTPQRFTPRAGSRVASSLRRALGGAIESKQRYGNTLEVGADGRVEARVARGGGIKVTPHGLMLDEAQVGEKNRPPIAAMRDLDTTATTADLITRINELQAELRRTGNMKATNALPKNV